MARYYKRGRNLWLVHAMIDKLASVYNIDKNELAADLPMSDRLLLR